MFCLSTRHQCNSFSLCSSQEIKDFFGVDITPAPETIGNHLLQLFFQRWASNPGVNLCDIPLSIVIGFCTKLRKLVEWLWDAYSCVFHLDMKEGSCRVCCIRKPPVNRRQVSLRMKAANGQGYSQENNRETRPDVAERHWSLLSLWCLSDTSQFNLFLWKLELGFQLPENINNKKAFD